VTLILPFAGATPRIHPTAWVAPGVTLIGDVELGPGSSVWYGSVLRGDVVPIIIGERANIQDMTMIHGNTGGEAVVVGDDVTIGHRVTLHGCVVEAGCLIGMGAIILDHAVVGAGSLVAAGAVVTPGTMIPPRSFVVGTPGKVRREISDDELQGFTLSAHHYTQLAALHRQQIETENGTR
jgi:carbonic anhydrase/acetyltransferase-like protein (isoleucine patch superfamily)